jgi:hypothetical protein
LERGRGREIAVVTLKSAKTRQKNAAKTRQSLRKSATKTQCTEYEKYTRKCNFHGKNICQKEAATALKKPQKKTVVESPGYTSNKTRGRR